MWARIRALAQPIPIEQIPAAIARNPRKRLPPIAGAWPLPVNAIRAWATTDPHWACGPDDVLTPPVRYPHCIATTTPSPPILTAGQDLTWTDLRNALVRAGMTAPTAAATILYSPVLRRTSTGYIQIGRPTSST